MALFFFGISFIIITLILLSFILLFVIIRSQKKGIIKKSIGILLIIFICFSSYVLVDWIMSFSQHFWLTIIDCLPFEIPYCICLSPFATFIFNSQSLLTPFQIVSFCTSNYNSFVYVCLSSTNFQNTPYSFVNWFLFTSLLPLCEILTRLTLFFYCCLYRHPIRLAQASSAHNNDT